MIIRAVTLGLDLEWPPASEPLRHAARALAGIVDVLQSEGHEVQTTRVALAPYYDALPADRAGALPRACQEIEGELNALGVGYVSFGPIRWQTLGAARASAFASIVTDAVIATSASFFSVEVADSEGIRFAAVQSAARMIRDISQATDD